MGFLGGINVKKLNSNSFLEGSSIGTALFFFKDFKKKRQSDFHQTTSQEGKIRFIFK